MRLRTSLLCTTALLCILPTTGCVKKIAMKAVAGALTAEGGTVFTGDNDPQLISDALPFVLKTYESLLAGVLMKAKAYDV